MRYAATVLLLTTLFAVASPAAQAQLAPAAWGLKGGVAFATLSGNDGGAFTHKTGVMGGAFLRMALSERLSLQPEFLYVQKGATGESGRVSIDLNMNYLEVPLLLDYSVPVMGTLQPAFFTGAYVGFPITREAGSGGVSVDFSEEVRDYDAGLMGGVRLSFPLMEQEGFFEVRYDLGLVDVSEAEFEELNTSTIALLLGIAF